MGWASVARLQCQESGMLGLLVVGQSWWLLLRGVSSVADAVVGVAVAVAVVVLVGRPATVVGQYNGMTRA